LAGLWEVWAKRCHVEVERAGLNPGPGTPQIANRALTIRCDVTPRSPDGVILAQGGRQHGYALHLHHGLPVFSVRIAGKLYAIAATEPLAGKSAFEAHLKTDGTMTLAINGRVVAQGKAPGLIPVQPQDELSVGEDTRTAVGDYTAPHPLQGTVENVSISPTL